MTDDPLIRIREIALLLPETEERESHGSHFLRGGQAIRPVPRRSSR
ncbi:hypothetical protein AB5I41_05545 [Sphingomonas sp. MMS24-JH45]